MAASAPTGGGCCACTLPTRCNVADQWELVKDFMRDEMFRGPVLALWLAVAGGALHAPVTPFFYLELGADYETIGWYSSIAACGALTAPLQGWYADRHGTYWMMMLGLVGCAVGCLIRGLSTSLTQIVVGILAISLGGDNLVSMTLAHIIKNTPVSRRAHCVAGFLAQIGACSLLGKSLFPAVDLFITSITHTDIARYRTHMSICIVFCFVGIFGIIQSKDVILSNRPLPKAHPNAPDDNNDDGAPPAAAGTLPPRDVECGGDSGGVPKIAMEEDMSDVVESPIADTRNGGSSPLGIILCLCALCSRMCCATVLLLVWPLYLKDRFGWGATEYSYCLVLSSVTNTITVSYSARVTDALGTRGAAGVFVGVALALGWTAFIIPVHHTAAGGQAAHVACLTASIAAIEALDFVVRLAASHHSLRNSQGRTFGGLVASSAFGGMIGSYTGASLYQTYADSPYGGFYPFALVSTALAVLLLALLISERRPMRVSGGKGHTLEDSDTADTDTDGLVDPPRRKDWCKTLLSYASLSHRRSDGDAPEAGERI